MLRDFAADKAGFVRSLPCRHDMETVQREQFPCFVMAPATTLEGNWAVPRGFGKQTGKAMLPAALEAMDALVEKHPVDSDRVYVTGQSMGGFGTFGAVQTRTQPIITLPLASELVYRKLTQSC